MGYFQTWLLYHNALSSGVEIEDILKFARRTKERASDDSGVVIELRSQVAEQQKIINQIILERDSKQVVVTAAAATSKISPTILNGKIKNNNSITNTGVVNSNLQPLLVVSSSKATKRDYGALDASNTATFNSNRSLDIANNSTKDDVASDIMQHSDAQEKDTMNILSLPRSSSSQSSFASGSSNGTNHSASNTDFVFSQPTSFPSRERLVLK